MRIDLHIGLEHVGAERLQQVLAENREDMASKGVLFARSLGNKNHTKLFMAVTDADHIDPLRYNRGYISAEKQAVLRDTVTTELIGEVKQHKPEVLILSCAQLGTSLSRIIEVERLRNLLLPLSNDIRIIAYIDEQARLLARHYGEQILEGRASSLDRELALAGKTNWWENCLRSAPTIDPQAAQFQETQTPAFWLDYARLVTHWESVFGSGSMHLRSFDPALFYSDRIIDELRNAFGIAEITSEIKAAPLPPQPAAAWLTRARLFNELLLRLLANHKWIVPRKLWRKFIDEFSLTGPPIDPASLAKISDAFANRNEALCVAFPALNPAMLRPVPPGEAWIEPDPQMGFRASQYLLAFMWSIRKATEEERSSKAADLALNDYTPSPSVDMSVSGLTPHAEKILPVSAKLNFAKLKRSRFRPHNNIGQLDEDEVLPPYDAATPRDLSAGSSGNVIVGCMKNEAPYILEWIAYHRAIGVENFLIYTNDCSDGTSEILSRLQEMGIVQHRNNDKWKGNSPQQYALKQALKEPVLIQSEWIIHIDVDEFINVRCGNGTLDDFLARVPEATSVAMTWRLFGHNGITRLADDFVINQFDSCAPKFCPKPHTAWGFKTMFRNNGAYQKISCHRPNKLHESFEDRVNWVNGSGAPMGDGISRNGWRNSMTTIGYDLLQLNHYALRSAESFLIKRQRGRALHVERSIGLNYWIRMDWSDHKDVTIKRNLTRLREEYDRLMTDDRLRELHDRGIDWHRTKAEELLGIEEFQQLYQQALDIKLTATERAAYALSLDMET